MILLKITDMFLLWGNSDLMFVILSSIVFILTFDISKISQITLSYSRAVHIFIISRNHEVGFFICWILSDFLYINVRYVQGITASNCKCFTQYRILAIDYCVVSYSPVIHLLSLLGPKVKPLASFGLRWRDFLDLQLFRRKFWWY